MRTPASRSLPQREREAAQEAAAQPLQARDAISITVTRTGDISVNDEVLSYEVFRATFAAIVVLSTLDLPIALAGLLISIEPLIDMGRTALNVSGSITAGAV